MTALDDLDRALAGMQGDDSGGTLPAALDAARRLRTEHVRAAQSEVRVRREVRALGYPLLALAWVVIGVGTQDSTPSWLQWAYSGAGFLALAWWLSWRPALPGDARPRDWWSIVRRNPWVWAVSVALGVGGGLTLGYAITSPGAVSISLAGMVLALSVAWVGAIHLVRRRALKRDRIPERSETV